MRAGRGDVAIGFAFGIFPGPGFVVGATNDRLEIHFVAHIADPPRRSTRLHDDQIDFLRGKELPQVVALRTDEFETVFARLHVLNTSDGVEFAKIE